jgi:uncharacterized protein (UPF0548 family)
MKFLTTATLNWLDDGCCDVKYLDMWNGNAVSYHPDQSTGAGWNTDHYELVIGHDISGALFQKAADLLMRYQFYPEDILSHVSDFNLWERQPQVGDRIVHRIHVLTLLGRPVLDVLGMTEISEVVSESRRQGFRYVTVSPHVEQGEWSAFVEWREDGNVVLIVDVISRPVAEEPQRNHQYIRSLQKNAHKRGLSFYKASVLA